MRSEFFENQIEQEEISDQFFLKITSKKEQTLEMDIQSDFKRLYQLYINANLKFQQRMQSKKTQTRTYEEEPNKFKTDVATQAELKTV